MSIRELQNLDFNLERCNAGVLFHTIYCEETQIGENLKELSFAKDRLVHALGLQVPSFNDMVEKMRVEKEFRTIEELIEQYKDEEEHAEEFTSRGYVNLRNIELLAETVYLLNTAYHFFNRFSEFKEVADVTMQDYLNVCAEHSIQEILEGSQTMDYRFAAYNEVQSESEIVALRPYIASLNFLTESYATHTLYVMQGYEGLKSLLLFCNDIRDNLLCTLKGYSTAPTTFLY